MKPDTFDIPAYKFGLVKINEELKNKEELTESTITNALNRASYNQQLKVIPFEDLDGLSVTEVRDLLKIEGPLILACYMGYKSFNMQEEWINFIATYSLSNSFIEGYPDKTIDGLFEIALESSYINLNDEKARKAARCFFERYQDNTHQDTVERISKLIFKNN